MNSELWNSGIESDKDLARTRKRKLNYISNILVVSDPANPQNEGKIFLYKYGKKIFDKIQEAMQPEFEDEDPINPFDFWGGANFKLKVRKVAGFINYDKSEFDSASPLLNGDDDELEALWKKQYSLTAFTDPSNFKSYDELKVKLNQVIGEDIRSTEVNTTTAEDIKTPFDSPSDSPSPASSSGNDMDAVEYFQKLADETGD
jgi:hypothetical protein